MRRAWLCCAALLVAFDMAAADSARRLLAVQPRSPWMLQRLEAHGADLVSYDPDTGVAYVIADAEEERRLFGLGFSASTVELDVDAGWARLQQDPGLGLYTTWDELVLELEALHAAFPELTHLELLGNSLEGRAIQALKISDEPKLDDPDEPDVLIVGNHHARELMSVEVPLHFARALLTGYRQDSRIRRLVDEREVWIVPMLNPDGHVHQEATQLRPGWRKNRRRQDDLVVGVDLNRNYPFKWGLDDVGSSGEPFDGTYRGAAPFSEPETWALGRLVERQDFKIALSYHSFGELLLYPWGHTRDHPTPDHGVYVALAENMVRDNGYRPGNAYSGAIYLTNGVWDDYMYGETNTAKSTQTFAFTVELNSAAEGGFWPAEEQIQPTCERLMSLNLYAVEAAADVRAAAPPLPPQLSAAQDEADGRVIHLHWQQLGDASAIDYYEVFEIDPRGEPGAWARAREGRLGRTGRAVLAEGVLLQDDGRLVLRMEAVLQPLWDYAYVEARPHAGASWTALEGELSRDSNPTRRNGGHGVTGMIQAGQYRFDAGSFASQRVDVAVRLDAYGDTPSLPSLSASVDVPETIAERRRVIATEVRDTEYDVLAERSGIFAYGVTAVDHDGQRTDSDLRWFVIPSVTAVEVQDVALERDGVRARLRWQTLSHTAARFAVWTRMLRTGEVAGEAGREWRTNEYVRAAERRVAHPGEAFLEWELQPGRHAILLVAEDQDGSRFWGPWVISRAVRTRLEPAWPNPFNPSTELRYEVASTSQVVLDIVDVNGRRVRRLVASKLPAGAHTVRWDGRDDDGRAVSSGVYVARLRSGAARHSRRLVLLR